MTITANITHTGVTLITKSGLVHGVVFDNAKFIMGNIDWKGNFRKNLVTPFEQDITGLEITPMDDGFGPIGFSVNAR